MAQQLFQGVVSKLRDELKGFLRMYVAAGTPLDFDYGIDFWFECKGQRVTFDITVNPRKNRRGRCANFILHI